MSIPLAGWRAESLKEIMNVPRHREVSRIFTYRMRKISYYSAIEAVYFFALYDVETAFFE